MNLWWFKLYDIRLLRVTLQDYFFLQQFAMNKYFLANYGMDNTVVLSTLSNSGNTTLEIPGTKAGNKIEVVLVR